MKYVYAIIKGERPLDDWYKFISEWKASGGDQILKDVTAYQKSKGAWKAVK